MTNPPPPPPPSDQPPADSNNPFSPPTTAPVPQKPANKQIDFSPIGRLKRAKALLGDQYMMFVGICFVGLLVAGAVPIVLVGPMMCGMFICYRERMMGRPASFDKLFTGFDKFAESLIAYIIQFIVQMVIIVPIIVIFVAAIVGIGIAMGSSGTQDALPWVILPAYFIYFVALILGSAIAAIPFTFTYPLIVDRGMSGLDACKASWTMAKPHFRKILWMYLVYGMLSIPLALCFYVPVFFFIPLVMGAMYTLYEDICGVRDR